MIEKYNTNSAEETQRIGEELAQKIYSGELQKNFCSTKKPSAIILKLSGNLGGGKTTFLQGFAKGLGVTEKILSPTFVILKHFKIAQQKKDFSDFYHIDCYRLNNYKDILELNFKELISNPKNIIAIEWPERIEEILPKNVIMLDFVFIDENKREINLKIC